VSIGMRPSGVCQMAGSFLQIEIIFAESKKQN